MTQPISKPARQLDELERIFGADTTRHGKCDVHGDYVDVHYATKGKCAAHWKGCPECTKAMMEEEGRLSGIRQQQEMHEHRLGLVVKNSGIPGRFLSKSFENFQPVNARAKSHLAKIQEYAELVSGKQHEGRCLILLGKVGNGKTHLGCALLQHVIRATGETCHYWTFSELVRSVKGTFDRESRETEESLYRDFARPRLVVLDEVGQQNFTEFEQAVAYEAINARYMEELPTVLITNLTSTDLPSSVGERAVDRLRENGGRALDFDWQSFRKGGAA